MVHSVLVRRDRSPDRLLLRRETRQLINHNSVFFVLLLDTIDKLAHVANKLLVILTILLQLLEHFVGADDLLNEVPINVSHQNELVWGQMRQKLL